jgi:hypothetical protein
VLKIAEINSQGASFGAEDSKESETGNKGGHYLKLNLQVKVMGNKAKNASS